MQSLSSAALEFVRCSLCDGSETKRIFSEDGFAIVRCQACGLIYPNPRLSEDALAHHYSTQYYGGAEPGDAPVDLGHYKRDSYRKAAREIRRLQGDAGKRALLDIGCGTGVFLEVARDFDLQGVGVELSERAAAHARDCRGLTVRTGALSDVAFAPRSFDVVTLWDVFEHIPDSNQLLVQIRTLLREDGLLVVRVPNAAFLRAKARVFSLLPRTLLARLLGTPSFTLWDPKEHLWNYSEQTLSRMLEKHGFRTLRSTLQETAHYGSRLRNIGHKLVYMAARGVQLATGRNWLGPVVVLYARRAGAAQPRP